MSKRRAGLAEGAFGLWIFACAVLLEFVSTETIPLYWWIIAFFFGPFVLLALLFLLILCFGGRKSGRDAPAGSTEPRPDTGARGAEPPETERRKTKKGPTTNR